MKSIADRSVDLIIADLPFGCLTNQVGKSKGFRRESHIGTNLEKRFGENSDIGGCSWDIKIDLDQFWREIRRIRKNDHTPCLMFCTTKYGFDLWESNKKEFRYDLVWDKQRGVSFLTANKMPMRSHEMIYVFSKAGANYYRKDIVGDFKAWNKEPNSVRKNNVYTDEIVRTISSGGDGKRCILSVLNIKQKASYQMKGQHPTEKPIDLYKYLIERYSKEGDTVFDPTFGSGNSGVASVDLQRKYIGIEKEPKFFYKFVSAIDRAK
jgi:site-specific DNA-methyltransferase (adenine-specific)